MLLFQLWQSYSLKPTSIKSIKLIKLYLYYNLQWNLQTLEQRMDSIFQIKINENKLHKILTQFNKDQQKLQKQMDDVFQQIKINDSNMLKWKKDLESKIQNVACIMSDTHSHISQQHKQQLKQVKKSIAQTAQIVFMKHSLIQQNIIANQKQINLKNQQLNERINQLTNVISQLQKKQTNEDKIVEKISSLQKSFNKMSDLTQILQNKNFLYFLQMLVDRQTGVNNFRISESLKQTKNPLIYQPNEQRTKRYKDVKRILHETQNRIQQMQTQYTGYFNSATQKNKQNREQTHMHYALLSTKIKQIENKLSEQQILGIQAQCVQKIMYPSQINIKEKVRRKNKRNSQMNLNQSSFCIQKCRDNDPNFEQLIQKLKTHTSKQHKQLNAKLEKIQDQIWSNNSKVVKIKQFCKVQLDKIQQKIKSISHYNQYLQRQSNSNAALNTKSLADFVHQFRNIQEDIEQKLKEKVDNTLYKKNQQQNYEKNRILSQQIEMKANKDEIRKAITFIQQKIKQIVTLIANMQNISHKTAGRKMIVQCLSCDDNFFQDNNPTEQTLNININSINNLSHTNTPRVGYNFTLRKDRQKIRHQYRKSNIQQ